MPRVFVVSYRGSVGEDLEREQKSEGVIKAALAQSRRAMKFGDTFGAVSALEGVKQVLYCYVLYCIIVSCCNLKAWRFEGALWGRGGVALLVAVAVRLAWL